MTTHTAARTFLLAVVVVGAFGAIGTGASLAYFSNSDTGNGTVSAASEFETPEPIDQAFNDSNGDGFWNDGEETYNNTELLDFDQQNANLVIPEGVDQVDGDDTAVSITAGTITSDTDILSKTSDVTLVATDGEVDIGGEAVTVDKGSSDVTINATEDVNASDASISTHTGEIRIETIGDIHFENSSASVSSGNSDIVLTAHSIHDQGAEYDPAGVLRITETGNGGG